MLTKMRLILIVFLIVGCLLLAFSVSSFFQGKSDEANGTITTGQVVNLVVSRSEDSTTYCPVVMFNVGQQKFIFESSYCSGEYRNALGETIEVLYQSDNPNNAMIHSFMAIYGAAVIFLIIGGVFTLFSALPLFIIYKRGKSGQRLRQTGTPVQAQIVEVAQNTAISFNGRSPYRIVAQWHDAIDKSIYVYYSQNLGFDPTPYIKQDTVTVYLDKKNPKKYYMDVSFLPKVK